MTPNLWLLPARLWLCTGTVVSPAGALAVWTPWGSAHTGRPANDWK